MGGARSGAVFFRLFSAVGQGGVFFLAPGPFFGAAARGFAAVDPRFCLISRGRPDSSPLF